MELLGDDRGRAAGADRADEPGLLSGGQARSRGGGRGREGARRPVAGARRRPRPQRQPAGREFYRGRPQCREHPLLGAAGADRHGRLRQSRRVAEELRRAAGGSRRPAASAGIAEMIPRKRLTRRQTLALGLAGLTLPRPFVLGGTAMAQTTPDTVVYVSNAGNKEIHVLAMNRDSGELALLYKVSVPGTDKPSLSSMPLDVTPDRRLLYAVR